MHNFFLKYRPALLLLGVRLLLELEPLYFCESDPLFNWNQFYYNLYCNTLQCRNVELTNSFHQSLLPHFSPIASLGQVVDFIFCSNLKNLLSLWTSIDHLCVEHFSAIVTDADLNFSIFLFVALHNRPLAGKKNKSGDHFSPLSSLRTDLFVFDLCFSNIIQQLRFSYH